ncbi:hypothetical protein [Burkholderia ubonensis]|uniref:hypothetical protein n=1 Tax=Burkholderia ubonensis TaxID=101571 RepID=UPI0008FEA062|nr:hypothetical protein [Burkholderia ubonensis]OJA97408.1 hypothetical protein BGV50_11590 [Burkholderia ubonensis]
MFLRGNRSACPYWKVTTKFASTAIDWHAYRERAAHANPLPVPAGDTHGPLAFIGSILRNHAVPSLQDTAPRRHAAD